ncbi:hypothetical protein IW261DRAFT_1576022 [Armillaria novae-zelandiae]|uniref:Uncharacterized protein n=1 Tax=Armillaria novae-zelandiae TaxID=153914 RepID=A0AA39NCV0_9AGAR|nr:hypothetical protein IW261DRAFT_1576022 [Armillaria novae-zelandiae]
MATPLTIAVTSAQLRSGLPLTLNFEAKTPGIYSYNIHFKVVEDDLLAKSEPVTQSQTQYDSPTEYECWVAEEALKRRLRQENEAWEKEDDDQLGIRPTPANQDNDSGLSSTFEESQTQYDSPTEYEHWVAEEAFKRRLAREIKDKDQDHKDRFRKQSPSDGNITADLADGPEHPVAQFLSIFLSPEFVTPKRPQCKFTAIQDLTVDQKLFNIDVILGDIVLDSQGESLEQYGIGLRHEQIQEEPSPLLGKRKARDEVEAL